MAENVIQKVMKFMKIFMRETLVKRIVSMILISLGIPNKRVTELYSTQKRFTKGIKRHIWELVEKSTNFQFVRFFYQVH